VLSASTWKGKRYPERPNPNFNREYLGCSRKACDYFDWTEPQATEQATKPPVTDVERLRWAREREVREAAERKAQAEQAAAREREAQAGVDEAKARSAKRVAAMKTRNPMTGEGYEVAEKAREFEADEAARKAAKVALLGRLAEKRRVKREKREAAKKAAVDAASPMDVDDVRAMFAAPG
jgi:hypothetical protein